MGMTSDSISCDYPQGDCCLASDYEDMLAKLRAQLAERDKTIARQRDGLVKAKEAFDYLKGEDEGCLGWVETDGGDWPIIDELLSKVNAALKEKADADSSHDDIPR